jgi:hypothetical protein
MKFCQIKKKLQHSSQKWWILESYINVWDTIKKNLTLLNNT